MHGLKSLFTIRRLVVVAVITILLYVIWPWKSIYGKKWYYYPAPCSYPEDIHKENIELAVIISKVLTKELIAHTLCYGSLWGALRQNTLLPWDPDVDFCVYSEDLELVDEQYFYRIFKKAGVEITYDSYNGIYLLSRGMARGELVVFELSDDFIWLQRVGVYSRWFSEENRERFPSKLMAPPLPRTDFGGHSLPIPLNDIEIQKYFYPEDWWKVVKPKGCK